MNRESLHKITSPLSRYRSHRSHHCANIGPPSLTLSPPVSFPAPITPDSTVKDDSGENGMPLAFLIPAFCHSLSIVTRRRSVHLGAATARSKWKIWRKKEEEEEGGGEKGGARFLPRRVAQSNYLGHATGINDKRIIFSPSLSLSLFPISIVFVTGIALLQDDAKFGCLISDARRASSNSELLN